MNGRIIPNILGKGWRFPGIGLLPTFWSLLGLELFRHLRVCHLACWCVQFSSVQSLSRVLLFATPWTAVLQADVLQWAYTEAWGLVVVDSSAILDHHLILMSLMSCTQARPFFLRLCPAPFPPISLFSHKTEVPFPCCWSVRNCLLLAPRGCLHPLSHGPSVFKCS